MSSDDQLIQILETIDEGRIIFDQAGVALYCNKAYLIASGLARDVVVGEKPGGYCASAQSVCNRLKHVVASYASDMASISNAQPIEVASLKTDRLTGLPNKAALMTDVDSLCKAQRAFSLILIGIDRLHVITNSLGWAGGDKAISEIAARLRRVASSTSILYRLSNTKFVFLLDSEPECFSENYLLLSTLLESPLEIHAKSFVIRMFAGVSEYPKDGDSANDLLKCAELAYNKAHDLGSKAMIRHEPGLQVSSLMCAEIEMSLRDALERESGLYLVFQPKVDIVSGNVAGAEALIRWAHPELGLLFPAQFLPIAKDGNLMSRIDDFVLQQALKAVAVWEENGLNCSVSINISADSLANPLFMANVKRALDVANVNPQSLEIEIPEGSLIVDTDASVKLLTSLVQMGVVLSVDDFGIGYSSLSYLSMFPVDTLKIDKSFITGIGDNPKHKKIVKSIIAMAHSLELEVVAEGVESVDEMRVLRSLNCNTAQGYYFGKPLSSEDFIQFVGVSQTCMSS